LVFKGGTYLWFFHNLNRFSEDLDFTAIGKLTNIVEKVSEGLELFGIENTCEIIKNTKYSLSFRVKAFGPLTTSEKDMVFIYCEISKRENILNEPLTLKLDFPQYNLPIKIIKGMELNEVGSEKIRAIITRRKARDVFDLCYLIKRKNILFEKSMVDKKLSYYKLKFSTELLENALDTIAPYYTKELKPFVFGGVPEFDECKKEIMKWVKGFGKS